MDWLHIHKGDQPVIVSVPHAGQTLLPGQAQNLIDAVKALDDTDFFVDRLYGFVTEMGFSLIRSDMSRLVIDLNRDPNGISLYPQRATTDLVPVTNFLGEPLYHDKKAPDDFDIQQRLLSYYLPYHAALRGEIDRLRGLYGQVLVYDAHSVRSVLPWLFDGLLPLYNIGTDGGRSCGHNLAHALERACQPDCVLNGRFKGGYITRYYSDPDIGVHCVQMELSKRGYMDEDEGVWDDEKAALCQSKLQSIMRICLKHAQGEL